MNDLLYTRTITVDTMDQMRMLFGNYDENIRIIEELTEARIRTQAEEILISAPAPVADMVHAVLMQLIGLLRKGETLDRTRVRYAVEMAREGNLDAIADLPKDVITITYRGKPVRAKTLGQRQYVEAMRKNVVTFSTGPAGTGKTYLAMAMAVVAYKNHEVERIVLTRPAVEAGEKLGFLPGDLQNKVDPYLRPLYDALYDFLGTDAYQKLSEKNAIEVAPLAYMRGRTLSDAFIILDEAQNTTREQMKMFLTRFGFGSKVVVTGDLTQIDLPDGRSSGLVNSLEVLKNIPGITHVPLTHRDVVRHELVQAIVKAYDTFERRQGS